MPEFFAFSRAFSCALALLSAVLLTACSSRPEPAPAEAPLRAATQPDLSGHWEKNYQLSDDFNNRFSLYIADIQRRFTAAQSRTELQVLGAMPGSISNDAINGLARFAEELTRMPLLEVEQDAKGIKVERENDFTLRCNYKDRLYTSSTNAFGADLCGWNEQRMLFQMSMGGGLGITHQFSLSADGSMLDLTTTVSSDAVATPLIVRNVYQRYEPPEQDYNCILTLTRSTVCSQRGTPK